MFHTWKLLNVTWLVPLLLGLWRRVFDYFRMLKDDDVDGSLDKDHAHVCFEHYQNNLIFYLYFLHGSKVLPCGHKIPIHFGIFNHCGLCQSVYIPK